MSCIEFKPTLNAYFRSPRVIILQTERGKVLEAIRILSGIVASHASITCCCSRRLEYEEEEAKAACGGED
jgi:hypothetical protein